MTDLEHIMLLQKWLEESYEKNKKLDEQNKKVTWHFRHTKGKWMKHGQTGERERIIEILRARVTKHHPILTIDISDLEALIKGEQK